MAKFKEKSRKQIKQEMRDNATIQDDGMSYAEIAEILGMTKAEVMKIEKAALRKLQAPSDKNKKLRSYHVG